MFSKNIYIESLLSLGGKQKKDSIDFISNQLLIRHKESRIEYTVKKVTIGDDGKPSVLCYRYYGPKNSKKIYIKIPSKEFSDYEPV